MNYSDFEQQTSKSIGSNSIFPQSEDKNNNEQTQNMNNYYSESLNRQQQAFNETRYRPYYEVISQIDRISPILVNDNHLVNSIGKSEQTLKNYIVKNKKNLTNLRKNQNSTKKKDSDSLQYRKFEEFDENLPKTQRAIVFKIKELYQKRIQECRDKKQIIYDIRQNLFRAYEFINSQILFRERQRQNQYKMQVQHQNQKRGVNNSFNYQGVNQELVKNKSPSLPLCYFCCQKLQRNFTHFCRCRKLRANCHERCLQNYKARHGIETLQCEQCDNQDFF